MKRHSNNVVAQLLSMLLTCGMVVGCSTMMEHTVPADRLPLAIRGPEKCELLQINLAILRQEPPPAYLIGPGDVLGIYVHGVVPPSVMSQTPILEQRGVAESEYYPPGGNVDTPNIGLPIPVQPNGQLLLPMIEPLPVGGLSLPEVSNAIVKAYVDAGVLQPGRQSVFTTLVKPRVQRVLVVREDVSDRSPTLAGNSGVVPYAKRGDAHVLDLPAYENDVLHALAASGGLPGTDAYNEVWVLHTGAVSPSLLEQTRDEVERGGDLDAVRSSLQNQCSVARIPLRWNPHEPLPFTPSDIILKTGDVVFIQSRTEFFYTGGLLRGGQIPLPRDQDVDVVDAISMAGGSVCGPPGGTNVFRAGAGPGFVIPPTRALISRKMPDGQQVLIRIDLDKAMYDPLQRVPIQPGDLVLLKYTPSEIAGNIALNIVGLNFSLDTFTRQ